jgi:hypothetical protein
VRFRGSCGPRHPRLDRLSRASLPG